jgi:hypothetical protein
VLLCRGGSTAERVDCTNFYLFFLFVVQNIALPERKLAGERSGLFLSQMHCLTVARCVVVCYCAADSGI